MDRPVASDREGASGELRRNGDARRSDGVGHDRVPAGETIRARLAGHGHPYVGEVYGGGTRALFYPAAPARGVPPERLVADLRGQRAEGARLDAVIGKNLRDRTLLEHIPEDGVEWFERKRRR